MSEIISFYSPTTNQGKRTLSLSFAKTLSSNDYKVLYVELDYEHPSFANSTQISDSTKNVNEYLTNAKLKNKFDLEPYILTKQDMNVSDKAIKGVINEIPKTLDFLTFPLNYDKSSFPTIVDSEDEKSEENALDFVKKMIFKMENTKYDYVLLNLPNDIQSIFGLSVLINSQKIVNVVTPNPSRLMEYRLVLGLLQNAPIDFANWFTILNQVSLEINENDYNRLIVEKNPPILVPYDNERAENEFGLKFGSETIDSKMEQLASMLGISVLQQDRKRKLFFSRG